MDTFWVCFIPIFVAVDAVGVLPLFISLTEGFDRKEIHVAIGQSVATALAVGVAFLLAGNEILQILGITIADFMIAGGILLFALSTGDLLVFEKRQRSVDPESLGAVPLGVPLIVGPAVLTTGLLLIRSHGHVLPLIALTINILIAGALFWFGSLIEKFLGKTGAKVVSKLAHLLLAAFGVMMVRKGIMQYLQ
jgi:multiple antibiotic resistance protein